MLPLRLTTTKYDKEKNFFTAALPDGEVVYFDPFVCCGIELTDEAYERGDGAKYENKQFILTKFHVQKWGEAHYMIIPDEGGVNEF